MKEIWKPINGYEGIYEVSNLGRVRSLGHFVGNQYIERRFQNRIRIIKASNRKANYKGVMIYKDGKRKSFLVHRLVAEAFIPNPNNFPEVNHKDEDKSNNCANNLEWCDRQYNNSYGTIKIRLSERNRNNCGNKPIIATLKDGTEVRYPSAREAGRAIGKPSGYSAISNALNGISKTAYGMKWRFEKTTI